MAATRTELPPLLTTTQAHTTGQHGPTPSSSSSGSRDGDQDGWNHRLEIQFYGEVGSSHDVFSGASSNDTEMYYQ